MNKSMIRFLLSKLLLIEAALLAIPLTVGLIYREPQSVMMSIVITMIILIILGLLGSLFKPKNYHIYTKEGMLILHSAGYFGPSLAPFHLLFQDKSLILSMLSLKYLLVLRQQEQLFLMTSVSYPPRSYFGVVLPILSVEWGF